MPAKAKSTKPAVKATKQTQTTNPDPSTVRAAYAEWKLGNVSVWDLKKKFQIRARILLPSIRKIASPSEQKVLITPGARCPKPAKAKAEADGKEASHVSRRAA